MTTFLLPIRVLYGAKTEQKNIGKSHTTTLQFRPRPKNIPFSLLPSLFSCQSNPPPLEKKRGGRGGRNQKLARKVRRRQFCLPLFITCIWGEEGGRGGNVITKFKVSLEVSPSILLSLPSGQDNNLFFSLHPLLSSLKAGADTPWPQECSGLMEDRAGCRHIPTIAFILRRVTNCRLELFCIQRRRGRKTNLLFMEGIASSSSASRE